MKMQDSINFKQNSQLVTAAYSTTTVESPVKSNSKNSKLFSAADLWNVQRQRRSIVIR